MIRIGIICPSEIALRRFLPALSKLPDFKFAGVAIADKNEWDGTSDEIIISEKEKAQTIISQYSGIVFYSYLSMIESDGIDAIYIPLPPALHYKWAKLALLSGKHILLEKPATTSYLNTKELIDIAKEKKLVIHENYMFAFHNQLTEINDIIEKGEIGDVRLYRISFGFPRRNHNDFRYNKKLGGGALLDCGGYTLKYASMLLGETARIVYSISNFIDDFEVDIYGSAVLINNDGTTVQIAFGMDNYYKCELEVWGRTGIIRTDRVLTAPDGYVPEIIIKTGNETELRKLSSDDAFMKSISKFYTCIIDGAERNKNYTDILKQAKLVDDFLIKANRK